jgi:hypothetical protein
MIVRPLGSVLFALALVACGSSTTGTTGTAGSGGAGGGTGGGHPARVPAVHRAAAVACPADRPAGTASGLPGAKCQKDSDCTQGTNGRCEGSIVVADHCSYDECAADADCGTATACECRNPASYQANVCVHGDCRLDADCGVGGYCSPSAVTLDPDCALGVSPGSIGYFCHTAGDTCVDDADCGSMTGEAHCIFGVDAMRWACMDTPCAG